MKVLDKLPLVEQTPSEWVGVVLADFDRFIIDHAACERKASALAMSFVVKFSDRAKLMEPMIALAKEELEHFHQVYRLIVQRGLEVTADEKDPYVAALLKSVRHGRNEHFLDRLLVSAVIEARGCERFRLIGLALTEDGDTLGPFYSRLAKEEAGHYKIFLNIANHYFARQAVEERFQQILLEESRCMLAVPLRPAVH